MAYPSIDSDEINIRLNWALSVGETHIRATYVRSCPVCLKFGMVQDGALATGLPLEHYSPEYGEVLKNYAMVCPSCGFDQAS